MQLQRDIRILGRIGPGLFQRDLIEGELFRAFAGDILEVDRLVPKVTFGQAVHVVASTTRVQHIGLEHGVEGDTAQRDPMVGQHAHVVLQVLPHLEPLRVLEQGPECTQHHVTVELVGHPGVVMRQRHVGGPAGLDRERYANDTRLHVIEAGGLGIDADQAGVPQRLQPAIETVLIQHRFVGRINSGRWWIVFGYGNRIVQTGQQAARFNPLVVLAQRRPVTFMRHQVGRAQVERYIRLYRGQRARQRQHVQAGAQALTDLALDLVGTRHQRIQGVELAEPLGRGLGSALGYAGDIVDTVAGQGEVIDDLIRPHTELVHYPVLIHQRIRHGVDQCHVRIHQLRHVLVTGGHEGLDALLGRLPGQGTDHIVRLDPVDDQKRQAHCADDV